MITKIATFIITLIGFSVASANEVYLPEPVKEQSGFYLIRPDYIYNFGAILPNSGVSLEVYDAGEQHNVIEYTVPEKFVFGAFYNNHGQFITVQGTLDAIHHNQFNVILARTVMGEVEVIGAGTILFDPFNTGNSHLAFFSFTMEEFSYFDGSTFGGSLLRISGNTIKKCLPIQLVTQPTHTASDYVDCNK